MNLLTVIRDTIRDNLIPGQWITTFTQSLNGKSEQVSDEEIANIFSSTFDELRGWRADSNNFDK